MVTDAPPPAVLLAFEHDDVTGERIIGHRQQSSGDLRPVLSGNLASCFCAAPATMTVQFMEQFRQSHEAAASDLSLTFANRCQLCLCWLITRFVHRRNRNRNRTSRSLKLQAITALDASPSLHTHRHDQLILLFANGTHVLPLFYAHAP